MRTCFNKKTILTTLAACLLLGALNSFALAQKYELKHNVRPGQRWEFDSTNSSEQKITATPENGAVQRQNQESLQRRAGSVLVLAAKDGHATAIRVHFNEECTDSVVENTNRKEGSFSLAGKTVNVKFDDEGKPVNDAKDLDPEAAQELASHLRPNNTIFPKVPVEVGDEWQGDPADLAKQFEIGPDDKMEVTCKLQALDSANKRMTANIKLTGFVSKKQGGITTTIKLDGFGQIDLLTGLTMHADVTGKLGVSGTQTATPPNGQPIKMTIGGDGKFHVIEDNKITSNGDDAPAPVPGPAVVMGNKALSGTFKSDQLTVELKQESGAAYSGFIVISEKKLPATATAENGKLTGNFESEGSKFPFTATVEGRTMTLVSGGTKYVLQKRVNPLEREESPRPRNPLGE